MKFYLLDIEGTVSSISFVKDELFPYSLARLEDFLSDHKNKQYLPKIASEIQASALSEASHLQDSPDSSKKFLELLIHKDIKSTLLKEIQGEIWKDGFESGELKSPMYPDVLPFLQKQRSKGNLIGIYSSGSVLAQKLFFRYSTSGDLSEYISSYFDTNVGSKREKESYLKISQIVGLPLNHFHFFTDVVEEGIAAQSAGMSVGILLRDGNPPQMKNDFPQFKDFSSVV
jgi:enolase-phosphatase E1